VYAVRFFNYYVFDCGLSVVLIKNDDDDDDVIVFVSEFISVTDAEAVGVAADAD